MQYYDVMNYLESYSVFTRGVDYYKRGRVGSFQYMGRNRFQVKVRGSHNYTVQLTFDSRDQISHTECDCPYNRGECKHIAAALLAFDSKLFGLRYDMASIKVKKLIRQLNSRIQQNDEISEGRAIVLEPELELTFGGLSFSLKIGEQGKRLYVVKDIYDLIRALDNGERKKYGKFCDTVVHWSLLSEYGQSMAKLAYSIAQEREYGYSYSSRRDFRLTSKWIDSFFELHRDKTVIFNGAECKVKYDYPKLAFSMEKQKEDLFRMISENDIICYDVGIYGCIYDKSDETFYMTDSAFAHNIKIIYENLADSMIYIDADDMPVFFNSVIKPISEHIELNGDDVIEQYAPPELEAKLYLDVPDRETITGQLTFLYGDTEYRAFKPVLSDSVRDFRGEKKAERLVLNYFNQGADGLYISGDDNIFAFISQGLDTLTDKLEVYASDAFNRLRIKPPAAASIGIHPEGNLLALDITADGYSTEELLELLNAYRRGKKYHRLRDGSFTAIDKGIEDLDEFAKSLNITDKMFLKENITIPQYRILYLNSLQSDSDSVRIKRGRDFKLLMNKYDEVSERVGHMDVPNSLQNIAREYQKHGFRWLKTIEEYGFGGILADDMGLGKTLQAIALMLDAKHEGKGKSLVVCPSSLVPNWESEIARFAPELSAFAATGAAAARTEGLAAMDAYDVIITSYQTLARDISLYEDKRFYLQFADEAQYIKNNKTQMAKAVKVIKSDVRFALTGTPVENSLAELWSIFDFIMPGYLFGYTYFKNNYEKPIVKKNREDAVKRLQRLTAPFILRRLKKDVLQELPEKTETVLRAKMDSDQSKLYSANVLQIKHSAAIGGNSGKIEILAMLTRLRRICCDPSLVYENYKGGSAKLELCMELTENCIQSGHKLLLFSQFTTMLDIIAKRLDSAGVSYYMLTGATKPRERLRMVNSFNKDNTRVFLISLKAGGTGLNLTGADIVIHYDPWWNVSAENQASDRAHRIGQKNNVQIYKLISEGTIEEKIIELQEKKRAISDLALDGEGDIMKMSVEDIMGILE